MGGWPQGAADAPDMQSVDGLSVTAVERGPLRRRGGSPAGRRRSRRVGAGDRPVAVAAAGERLQGGGYLPAQEAWGEPSREMARLIGGRASTARRLLADLRAPVRRLAIMGLAEIPSGWAMRCLLGALGDADETVRAVALEAIERWWRAQAGRRVPPRVVRAVRGRLGDPSEMVRICAVWATARLGGTGGARALVQMYAISGDENLKGEIAGALAASGFAGLARGLLRQTVAAEPGASPYLARLEARLEHREA